VAAALAGAVVVVLGYASGLGLRIPLVEAAVVPPAVTAPEAPAAPAPVPAPAVVIPPAVAMTPAAPAATPSVQPVPTPAPTPPTTPQPTPTAQACDPGLLGGLLAPVDSLLNGLLGADLLGGSLLGETGTSSTVGGGLLSCTVGSLVGSSCCETLTARRSTGASR